MGFRRATAAARTSTGTAACRRCSRSRRQRCTCRSRLRRPCRSSCTRRPGRWERCTIRNSASACSGTPGWDREAAPWWNSGCRGQAPGRVPRPQRVPSKLSLVLRPGPPTQPPRSATARRTDRAMNAGSICRQEPLLSSEMGFRRAAFVFVRPTRPSSAAGGLDYQKARRWSAR